MSHIHEPHRYFKDIPYFTMANLYSLSFTMRLIRERHAPVLTQQNMYKLNRLERYRHAKFKVATLTMPSNTTNNSKAYIRGGQILIANKEATTYSSSLNFVVTCGACPILDL